MDTIDIAIKTMSNDRIWHQKISNWI